MAAVQVAVGLVVVQAVERDRTLSKSKDNSFVCLLHILHIRSSLKGAQLQCEDPAGCTKLFAVLQGVHPRLLTESLDTVRLGLG